MKFLVEICKFKQFSEIPSCNFVQLILHLVFSSLFDVIHYIYWHYCVNGAVNFGQTLNMFILWVKLGESRNPACMKMFMRELREELQINS